MKVRSSQLLPLDMRRDVKYRQERKTNFESEIANKIYSLVNTGMSSKMMSSVTLSASEGSLDSSLHSESTMPVAIGTTRNENHAEAGQARRFPPPSNSLPPGEGGYILPSPLIGESKVDKTL